MTAKDFVKMAEGELAEVVEKTPDQYREKRDAIVAQAPQVIDGTVDVHEVSDAIPATLEEFQEMLKPPRRIEIPGSWTRYFQNV